MMRWNFFMVKATSVIDFSRKLQSCFRAGKVGCLDCVQGRPSNLALWSDFVGTLP